MRVLALVTLPTLGAGNRLRVEQYVPLLCEQGVELEVSSFFDDLTYSVLYRSGHLGAKFAGTLRGLARRARDLVRARRYDVLLVYRESAPLGPPIVERLLGSLGVPYIFDFDDAIYLAPIHPANRRWSWLRHPSRVVETARRARAVIAGNDYLAESARRHNERVTVIPTPVDTERFRPIEGGAPRSPVVLGWVGSSTTAPYLRLLDEPLAALARRRDVLVRVIGGEYRHPTARVECLPYRLTEEPRDVAGFDIGLLRESDELWTRGKGAFKAMLYMATGVPVIASRVGVNAEVIGEGVGGLCVDGPAEWIQAIERLADDSALRRRMGAAGRERVERLYSLRVQAPRLASVLLGAAGRSP